MFGFLGSFSVTDGGGVSELQGTNIPDIGTRSTRTAFNLPNNFSPVPLPPGWETGPAKYYQQDLRPEADEEDGVLRRRRSRRLGSQARRERAVLESLGYEIVYTREVQPNEPNYTGDVIQMRNQGVQNVMWEGQADQIAELWSTTMDEQDFHPDAAQPGVHVLLRRVPEARRRRSSEGSRIDVTHALFLDASNPLPEVQLFREWMAKVDPNQDVDLFALYAWASGRMIEKALRDAGPNVTRDKVLAALRTVTTFDANGLIAPVNPAGKQPDRLLRGRPGAGRQVRSRAPRLGLRLQDRRLPAAHGVAMRDLLAFTIVGIVTGSIYAIAASGLVVTYTTSGVFNFAHGAIGMVVGVPLLAGEGGLGLGHMAGADHRAGWSSPRCSAW